MLNTTENDMIKMYFHCCNHIVNLRNKHVQRPQGKSITIFDIYGVRVNLRDGLAPRQQSLIFL